MSNRKETTVSDFSDNQARLLHLSEHLAQLNEQLPVQMALLAEVQEELDSLREQSWILNIRSACWTQCPNGYSMTIKSPAEWQFIASAVNMGIDAHLEAVSSRSSFDAATGKCVVHPDELHTLLRRLYELAQNTDQDDIVSGSDLAESILVSLDLDDIRFNNPWL